MILFLDMKHTKKYNTKQKKQIQQMTFWTDKTIPVKYEISNKKPKTKQHIGLHEKQERY